MRVLGIDEAGRGCVFGDLVVAGFFAESPDDAVFREAGADDSKKLSRKRRDAARLKLANLGEADVVGITAGEIDRGNLNDLEEQVIIGLIARWRPDAVFIDALGHPSTLPKLILRLQAALPKGLRPTWTIEPKADSTYPIVGAASIFAKTTRDNDLDALKESYGVLGSGYPSDPKTRAWLTNHARTGQPWPPFVRTRWQTVQDLAQQALI